GHQPKQKSKPELHRCILRRGGTPGKTKSQHQPPRFGSRSYLPAMRIRAICYDRDLYLNSAILKKIHIFRTLSKLCSKTVHRWITTIAVMAATLANGQWFFHCKPAVETAVNSTEEVPECCRQGLCPHHAAEHKAPPKPQKNDKDDCICGIASSDPITLVA